MQSSFSCNWFPSTILHSMKWNNTVNNVALSVVAVFSRNLWSFICMTCYGNRPLPNAAAVATATKRERVRTTVRVNWSVGLVCIGAPSLMREMFDRNSSSWFAAVSVGSIEPDGLTLWVDDSLVRGCLWCRCWFVVLDKDYQWIVCTQSKISKHSMLNHHKQSKLTTYQCATSSWFLIRSSFAPSVLDGCRFWVSLRNAAYPIQREPTTKGRLDRLSICEQPFSIIGLVYSRQIDLPHSYHGYDLVGYSSTCI